MPFILHSQMLTLWFTKLLHNDWNQKINTDTVLLTNTQTLFTCHQFYPLMSYIASRIAPQLLFFYDLTLLKTLASYFVWNVSEFRFVRCYVEIHGVHF